MFECKNAELFGADFIYLGPFEDIGIIPYETISPKKQAYEWMILNCTTPIFAFGNLDNEDINTLFEKTILGGTALSTKTLNDIHNLELIYSITL